MNLIANSGIQYFTFPLEINLNDSFKMYFHEWFEVDDEQLKLEIAHNFSEEGIWVSKRDLLLLGYLTEGKVGRIENGKLIPFKWQDIKEDFYNEGYRTITPMEDDGGGSLDCFPMSLNKCRFEKFENKWLPFPFFNISDNGKSSFGPTNWCRIRLVPANKDGNVINYYILLAFDTRTIYERENYEDEYLNETPVFASEYEKSKEFALCGDEFLLIDFCSKLNNCEWIDEYIWRIQVSNATDLVFLSAA
ncbi:MAG: virulence factor SrfB [Saprospiraceae bacterium]|nr:virulence factor SrfB [Saprospiraceae bacterium]